MNPKHLKHAILVRRTPHNSAVGSKPTELRRVLIAALLLALLLALPAPVAALTSRYLFVSSYVNSKVVLYDGTTGALIGDFVTAGLGGLGLPFGLVFGPDGNLYVSSSANHKVVRYNGTTGAFIDDFVTAGSGGLSQPAGLVFGPDGNLYVMSRDNHKVLRYNGTTGAPFPAPDQSGADFATVGLSESLGLAFGPDGNLYVSSTADSKVVRFNGTTGAFIDDFVATGVGGLNYPFDLVFRPDGNLYVVSYGTNKVLRYNGTTGAPFPAPGQSGADFATAGLMGSRGFGLWSRRQSVRQQYCRFQSGALQRGDG